MGFLNRDAILKANDLTTKAVEVTEWGGSVSVRLFTAGEFEVLAQKQGEAKKQGKETQDNFLAYVVSLAAVDDAGARLFTDKDIAALAGKSFAALSKVALGG